jgi:hypothetical protein
VPVLRAKDAKDREDRPVGICKAEVAVHEPQLPEVWCHAAGGVLMSSRVLVTDKARIMLEEEQDRRIKEGWKRGYSLEQIATEAINFFFLTHESYGYRDHFKDSNEPLEEGF